MSGNDNNFFFENNSGISDTLGAIFLIAIFAIAVAIIGSGLLSQTEVVEVPAADLSLSIEDSVSLKLYNDGGDTIRKAGNIIYVDGADRTDDFITEGGGPWTVLEAGNYIELPLTEGENPVSVLVVNELGGGGSELIAALGDTIISPGSIVTPETTPPTTSTETPTPTATAGGPPAADFSGSPTSGTRPLAVTFTDLSTESPTSWSWTFGDGNSSALQNPSHTYAAAGTYTVSLTATNIYGSDTETKTNYITVTNPAPVADFSGSPTSGERPLSVTFTDLSVNGPTSWAWTFGDGNTSALQNPSHTYAAAGTYTVTLNATNAGGFDTETKTNYITVTEPVPTVIFFDDFEDGNINGWTYYRAWTTSSPAIGSYSAYFWRNGYISQTIPTTGYTGINVSFYLGASTSLDSGESVGAYWSPNGYSWNLMKQINNGDPEEDGQLHFFSYVLPATADNNANFALRFSISANRNNEYGYVDNVRVEGYD